MFKLASAAVQSKNSWSCCCSGIFESTSVCNTSCRCKFVTDRLILYKHFANAQHLARSQASCPCYSGAIMASAGIEHTAHVERSVTD